MNLTARHTKIVEQISTSFVALVREDYFGYPEAESNIYMVGPDGTIRWFAERAMEKDAFANPIHELGNTTFKCASWKGFTCEIELKTGKLVNAEFT